MHLNEWRQLLVECRGHCRVLEGRLEQNKGSHHLWRVDRELDGDGPTTGVRDDLGLRHADMFEKRSRVVRLFLHGGRTRWWRASPVAASAVADQLVVGEGRLAHYWQERVGDDRPMNEEYGFTVAAYLELDGIRLLHRQTSES
jgi:hypothetical protein